CTAGESMAGRAGLPRKKSWYDRWPSAFTVTASGPAPSSWATNVIWVALAPVRTGLSATLAFSAVLGFSGVVTAAGVSADAVATGAGWGAGGGGVTAGLSEAGAGAARGGGRRGRGAA